MTSKAKSSTAASTAASAGPKTPVQSPSVTPICLSSPSTTVSSDEGTDKEPLGGGSPTPRLHEAAAATTTPRSHEAAAATTIRRPHEAAAATATRRSHEAAAATTTPRSHEAAAIPPPPPTKRRRQEQDVSNKGHAQSTETANRQEASHHNEAVPAIEHPPTPPEEPAVVCMDFKRLWTDTRNIVVQNWYLEEYCSPEQLRNAERHFFTAVAAVLRGRPSVIASWQICQNMPDESSEACCCWCCDDFEAETTAWSVAPRYHQRLCEQEHVWYLPPAAFKECATALKRFLEDLAYPHTLIIYQPVAPSATSRGKLLTYAIQGEETWLASQEDVDAKTYKWVAYPWMKIQDDRQPSRSYLLHPLYMSSGDDLEFVEL